MKFHGCFWLLFLNLAQLSVYEVLHLTDITARSFGVLFFLKGFLYVSSPSFKALNYHEVPLIKTFFLKLLICKGKVSHLNYSCIRSAVIDYEGFSSQSGMWKFWALRLEAEFEWIWVSQAWSKLEREIVDMEIWGIVATPMAMLQGDSVKGEDKWLHQSLSLPSWQHWTLWRLTWVHSLVMHSEVSLWCIVHHTRVNLMSSWPPVFGDLAACLIGAPCHSCKR